MNFCAIICEYNPMHNGHIYQIEQARKISGNNILCVMGGNFSQRGETCVLNKYQKTNIALNNGADIVIELPTIFATQSAEIFALSSIKILNSFKNVTHLCFGCEYDDLNTLSEIANFLLKPTKEFKQTFKQNLKNGYSYSLSIQKSLDNNLYREILSKPNNMLAIEYLKALKITKSHITPIAIKREDNYNSTNISNQFASATAIRDAVFNNKTQEIKNFIPNDCYEELLNFNGIDADFYNNLVKYKIETEKNVSNIFGVSEGIEKYILKNTTATKRYSQNKLNRTKLNIALNIKKKVINKLYNHKIPYIKILGAKKECLKFLTCNTNLIIRNNDIKKKNKFFSEIEEVEKNANLLYNFITNSNLEKESLYVKCLIK